MSSGCSLLDRFSAYEASNPSISNQSPEQTQTTEEKFTVLPPPSIIDFSPKNGPITGGTLISISGTNFRNGAFIEFGTDILIPQILNPNEARFVTPPGNGSKSIKITNPDQKSHVALALFKYDPPAPILHTIEPIKGSFLGGESLIIRGASFQPGSTLTLSNSNGSALCPVSYYSSDYIVCTTPPHKIGVVSITLTQPDGQSSTLINSYTYGLPSPQISQVAPNLISPSGALITVEGDHFALIVNSSQIPTVLVGNQICNNVTLLNYTNYTTQAGTILVLAKKLECQAPAHFEGYVSVKVINPDGQSVQLDNALQYIAPPNSWMSANYSDSPFADAPGDQNHFYKVIWTGSHLLTWGTCLNGFQIGPCESAGKYLLNTNTWLPVSTVNQPQPRMHSSVIWSGSEMIVFGGITYSSNQPTPIHLRNGGRYNPTLDQWLPMTIDSQTPIGDLTAPLSVWYQNRMITILQGVAGAVKASSYFPNATGGYWESIPLPNYPIYPRKMVLIGSKIFFWGKILVNGTYQTGFVYDINQNSWHTINQNFPLENLGEFDGVSVTAFGNKVLIYGGYKSITGTITNSGQIYDSETNTWHAISLSGAPTPRYYHSAILMGNEVFIYGGISVSDNSTTTSGGRYNLVTNTWLPVTSVYSPSYSEPALNIDRGIWTGAPLNKIILIGTGSGSTDRPKIGIYTPGLIP